jgi:predicted secreted protein
MTAAVPPPTVSVSASLEREIAPDKYTISARVTGEGNDTRAATAELVSRYRKLESAAKKFPGSVEVRHSSIASWPGWGKRAKASAHRTMTVIGTDPATAGDVADRVAAVAGVALDGPHWELGDDNPSFAQLQADVVHEARDRAARYAAALGGSLGRLVELRDPQAGGGHRMYAAAAPAMFRGGDPEVSDLDLSPQPITISATIEATWYVDLPE